MRIMNIAHGEFLMLGRLPDLHPGARHRLVAVVVHCADDDRLVPARLALHFLIFRRLAATSPNPEAMEARSLIVGFGLMFIARTWRN